MVPLRTSALDNSGKMWQGQRFRGSEAAESVFYEVSAALTCHRCVHSHKPPVRQRAFAPAVPLKGFSTEKPPLGSSKLIPHNSSTEEQNAKNTHPLRCKLAQGPSENGLPRPSPPEAVADGNFFAFHKRCAVCSPRSERVYVDSIHIQMLHSSSFGLFIARTAPTLLANDTAVNSRRKKVGPEFLRHA